MGQTKTESVIDLVHHLDELKAQRAKMVAELDAEIAVTLRELAKLTGEAPARTANGASAPVGRAAKELELVMVEPAPKKASFADIALSMLRENPKASLAQLAVRLYGENDVKSREKARAVLYFLSTKERIRKTSDDGWEVITVAS